MNVQQLLQFCSYFHLNKQAAGLPLSQLADTNEKEEIKQKPQKTNRKKIQIIETKKPKTNKPGKIQKVTKPKIQNIYKEERPRIVSKNQQSYKQKQGLEYFISHLKGDPQTKSYNDTLWKPTIQRKHQASNYDTFGTKQKYYEPHKMTKEQNPSLSPFMSRTPHHIYNNLYQRSHSPYANPQNGYPLQQNFMIEKQANRRYQEVINRNDYQRYSPIRNEELSISRRKVYSPVASEKSLSKTRTKNKNTRIQRPFYDPPKLRPLEGRDSEISNNRQQNITNSFLSSSMILNEESKIRTPPKKHFEEQRRQTGISTISVNKNEHIGSNAHEYDLDDNLANIIGPLVQRNIKQPIIVTLNPQGKKY